MEGQLMVWKDSIFGKIILDLFELVSLGETSSNISGKFVTLNLNIWLCLYMSLFTLFYNLRC